MHRAPLDLLLRLPLLFPSPCRSPLSSSQLSSSPLLPHTSLLVSLAYLSDGVGEMFLSSRYCRDAHQRVINSHAEVVDRNSCRQKIRTATRRNGNQTRKRGGEEKRKGRESRGEGEDRGKEGKKREAGTKDKQPR